MFNFTTTTIINSDKDYTSGKALYSSVTATGNHGALLRIKRDFTFELPYITKIYTKEAAPAKMAEFTFNCTNLLAALSTPAVYPVTGRVALFVALEGSEESSLANDFYQKGLPISVGFSVNSATMTGVELAKQIEKTVRRYNLASLGKVLFEVSASGDTLTFKSTDEYLRFKYVRVFEDHGNVEKELVHYVDGEQDNSQNVVTLVQRGIAGFGTFRHLMKDLRLPTSATYGLAPLDSQDRPVPGALYNQYIINYTAPSQTNPSMVAVGHETESTTTHVFWVRQDFAPSFEAVVTAVIGSGPTAGASAVFEKV
jgi:hypothetical protein